MITDLRQNFPIGCGWDVRAKALLRSIDTAPLSFGIGRLLAQSRPSESLARALSALIARPGWTPDPVMLSVAASGRAAVAAAISALVPKGKTLGVEALSYPPVAQLACMLGIEIVPLGMDHEGLLPAAVQEATKRSPLGAVYFQPIAHNPLGTTISSQRADALSRVFQNEGILALEDCVFGFLDPHPAPPLTARLTPGVLIDSLSKRVAPGLSLGIIAASSAEIAVSIQHSIYSGSWSASGLICQLAQRLVETGLADELITEKRLDAMSRRQVAERFLRPAEMTSGPALFHLWLELPTKEIATTLTHSCEMQGVLVTDGGAFAMGPKCRRHGIRLALGNCDIHELEFALDIVADNYRRLIGHKPLVTKTPSSSLTVS